MAKLYFTSSNEIYRIFENDSDESNFNEKKSNYIIKEVSDSDFLLIKQSKKFPTYNGTDVILEDTSISFEDASQLQEYINNTINNININYKISQAANKEAWRTYKDTILNFDVSSISYPLNKTWEEYCENNSITYFHPLQMH